MTAFEQAFGFVVGNEGGYTDNPNDPGNWTGGQAGRGECRGTKYGISAKAYPAVAIAELTLEDAKAIYQRDYWDKIGGDGLPGPLALLVFDAAVNNGVARARQWLTAAQRQENGAAMCAEFQSLRMTFMAALPTWKLFGNGWARRLCRLPYQGLLMEQ